MSGFLEKLPLPGLRRRHPLVTVLPLSGVIGGFGPMRSGMTLSRLAPLIERAFAPKRLSAVALAINSPGGSPVQSDLIARRIRALAAEKEVEVFAFTEDVAASGGYWLACAADKIYANPSSIVGSIGVISAGFGLQGLIERVGVERRLHTAGDKKSLLDPFLPEDPADVKRLKSIQKEMHETFKAMVRERRGDRLKGAERTLFSGEFWIGGNAQELGLVDEIGDLRQVMRARFGDKVRLKRVEPPRSWLRRGISSETPLLGPDLPERLGENLAEGLLAAAESRALWSRYGL